MSSPEGENLLDTEAAAEVLGVSPRTMEDWRWRGGSGLPFYKLGKRLVRYRLDDLKAFAFQSKWRNTGGGEMS